VGQRLIDAGPVGHINATSSLGDWLPGLQILTRLSGHEAARLAAALRVQYGGASSWLGTYAAGVQKENSRRVPLPEKK